jgi:type I restriction enzyme S subunit
LAVGEEGGANVGGIGIMKVEGYVKWANEENLTTHKPNSFWPLDRVKDIIEKIGSGVTPAGGAASYAESGIPFLRSQNIHFDGLHLDDVAYITEETHDEMSNSRVRDFDVLLNITGASIGRCTFIPKGFGEANVNQHVCIIRPSGRVYYKFLTYALSSPYGQDQIFSSFTGASRQGLNFKDLGDIQIPLPSLADQKRIASYLDASCKAIDGAIATKRRQIETLGALAEAMTYQAVMRGLNPNTKTKPSEIDWLPEVPAHWTVQQIKRACSLLRGKFGHRPRNDPALYGGEYPFVQTGDITAAQKYIRTYSQTLNELGLGVSKMFPRGTLVMSIAANIGDVAILDFEACFPDSMIGLIPDHKTDLNYLYYLMRSMKGIMLRSAILSTQLNLNYVRIGTNFAAFPPQKEQEAIAEFVETKEQEVFSIKTLITQQVDTLAAYRKFLIHECVTGKRRITESDLARLGTLLDDIGKEAA